MHGYWLPGHALPRDKLGAARGNPKKKCKLRWRSVTRLSSHSIRHTTHTAEGATLFCPTALVSIPIAVTPAPTVAMARPSPGHPMGLIVRSRRPIARCPGVGPVSPSPMPADPNVHRAWRDGDPLLNHLRWFLRGDFIRRIEYSILINHAFVDTTGEGDRHHAQQHQKNFHREPHILFLRTRVL